MAGDQQAALFGQTAFEIGDSKCTYGTGAFYLTNTGGKRIESNNGLISTIAWMAPNGEITYALEGSVFVAGSAVQWLRDGLKIIKEAKDVEALASSVDDSDGVIFVPALTGLGAPWWKPDARGTIFGITRGTTIAHIARATLEAVACQVTDLAEAMEQDLGQSISTLRVDGGMAQNNLLLQLQADFMKAKISRGKALETTGIGAAFLAALGAGLVSNFGELQNSWQSDREFVPIVDRDLNYRAWKHSISSTY